jgi:hypothetical protein
MAEYDNEVTPQYYLWQRAKQRTIEARRELERAIAREAFAQECAELAEAKRRRDNAEAML